MEWLLTELTGKRPLMPPNLNTTPENADVLNTFKVHLSQLLALSCACQPLKVLMSLAPGSEVVRYVCHNCLLIECMPSSAWQHQVTTACIYCGAVEAANLSFSWCVCAT